MVSVFRFLHALLGLGAIGTGVPACLCMIAGRRSCKSLVRFLRFSLAASALGLLLSIDDSSFALWVTVLGVYASAFVALSLRKSQSCKTWDAPLVLGAMCVFCLDAVIAIAHILRLFVQWNLLVASRQAVPLAYSIFLVVVSFASLSILALKKIPHEPCQAVMHKAAR